MSIADEITRLKKAKKLLRTAISSKGVDIDSNLSISDYYKKVFEIPINGGDYENGYEAGYEDGKNSVVQVVKLSTTFSNFFYQTTYPQDTEILLEYGEYFVGTMANMCRYSKGIKSVKIIGNKDITLNVQGTFQYAYDLELVDMSECSTKLTNIQNLFNGASKLKTIKGDLNFEKGATIVTPFGRCSALVDVSFVEGCIEKSIAFAESSLLSDISIQSIIDGLADLTGGTAQELDFHADIVNKLSIEQLTQIASKNWSVS